MGRAHKKGERKRVSEKKGDASPSATCKAFKHRYFRMVESHGGAADAFSITSDS